MRAFIVITFAVLIDLFQALMSAGLFIITAFPGTTVGAAVGCAVGQKIAGAWGCSILGAVAGVVGSAANVIAPITIPLGVVAGFAVNICISMTFGFGLIALLYLFDMLYPQYVFSGGLIELIPGLDDLPGWSTMAILCVIRKKADDAKLKGSATGAFASMALAGVSRGVMGAVTNVKQFNQSIARQGAVLAPTQEEQDVTGENQQKFIAVELKNIDGIRRSQQNLPPNQNQPPTPPTQQPHA